MAGGFAKSTVLSASSYAAAGGKGVEFSRSLRGNILLGEKPAKDLSLKPFSRFSLCQAPVMAKMVNLSIKVNIINLLTKQAVAP